MGYLCPLIPDSPCFAGALVPIPKKDKKNNQNNQKLRMVLVGNG